MKRIRFNPDAAKRTKFVELLQRFVFGGCLALLTGAASRTWGAEVGGLFLAFPAILPASVGLVQKHNGRACAVDEVRGARLGCFGLAAFALAVMLLAERLPAKITLLLALLAWFFVSASAWVHFIGVLPRRLRR